MGLTTFDSKVHIKISELKEGREKMSFGHNWTDRNLWKAMMMTLMVTRKIYHHYMELT